MCIAQHVFYQYINLKDVIELTKLIEMCTAYNDTAALKAITATMVVPEMFPSGGD